MLRIDIRQATPQDVPLLMNFIRALAEYERLAHDVTATERLLHRALFGHKPFAEAVIAEVGPVATGFAVFYQAFSTFLAKPGLYLEDLFVNPAWRGRGVGRALFQHIARLAHTRGCGRFEWSVLNWNEPAIRFYEKAGARAMKDWTVYRLDGDALRAAAEAPSPL